MSSRGLVGPHPSFIVDDVYQLPSGQFVVISPQEFNYSAAEAYCTHRGMHPCSIHDRADSDALEYLLDRPTFLGGSKTGEHGEWTWFDGSPWDFNHSVFDEDASRAFGKPGRDDEPQCPPACVGSGLERDRCADGGGLLHATQSHTI
jgi:hypothetical protein